MIQYAAASNATALDRDPRNPGDSPYTTALAKYLTAPDMEVDDALREVTDYVKSTTQQGQVPYMSGSLGHEHIYLGSHSPAKDPNDDATANYDSARTNYDLAKRIGTRAGYEAFLRMNPPALYVELAKGELQRLASLENAKPKDEIDAGTAGRLDLSKPRDPPRPLPLLTPQVTCALELESASVDVAGVGHFVVNDKCGKLDVISIGYGGSTFTQRSATPNRAEFAFDFFAGPSVLAIRATDGRQVQYQAPYFDQNGLAKAVVIWEGTTDLDMHAFENAAEPNSPGDVWRGNPRSLNDTLVSGGGFISQLGETTVPGAHVQVYTYRRHSFSNGWVEFRVNQHECAANAPRVPFRMLRYESGVLRIPDDGPARQGTSRRQCGTFAGNDKESWAPRAKALDLKIPF